MKNFFEKKIEGVFRAVGDVVEYGRCMLAGHPDIICRRIGDDVIYWPVTRCGRECLRKAFVHGCPRKRFGYAVPSDQDGRVYEVLHRTYASSIGRMGSIGSTNFIVFEA